MTKGLTPRAIVMQLEEEMIYAVVVENVFVNFSGSSLQMEVCISHSLRIDRLQWYTEKCVKEVVKFFGLRFWISQEVSDLGKLAAKLDIFHARCQEFGRHLT